MCRKIAIIEFKYGFGGNFKPIIKLQATIGILTFPDVNYKNEIHQFLVQNFKLNKVEIMWMYDLVGEFT